MRQQRPAACPVFSLAAQSTPKGGRPPHQAAAQLGSAPQAVRPCVRIPCSAYQVSLWTQPMGMLEASAGASSTCWLEHSKWHMRHQRAQNPSKPYSSCPGQCSQAGSPVLHCPFGAHHRPALHSAASKLPSTQAWPPCATCSCSRAVQEKRSSPSRQRCATSARHGQPCAGARRPQQRMGPPHASTMYCLPAASHLRAPCVLVWLASTTPGYLSSSFSVLAPTRSLRLCSCCQRSAVAALAVLP